MNCAGSRHPDTQQGEYKRVANKEHDGMNDRPNESAHRADVTVFEVTQNQILQQIPICIEFLDKTQHSNGYTGHFSPLKDPLFTGFF
jgi:hypothetical protein